MYCSNQDYSGLQKYYNKYAKLINIDSLNGVGKTLAHHAVEGDNTEILVFLLEQGANIEIIDNVGHTPLLQAVKHKKYNCMKCLLNNFANPYITDVGGIYTTGRGSRVKCENVSIDESSDPIIVVFRQAGGKRNKIQETLTEYMHDLPIEFKFRFMVQAGKLSEIKELLKEFRGKYKERGQRIRFINSTDEKYGKSALHYAIEKKENEIILLLLKQFADPDLQDMAGNTPLHFAVIGDYYEGIHLLLFGKTSQRSGKFKFSYHGAAEDIQNKHGYTPEKIAQLLERKQILSLFENKRNPVKDESEKTKKISKARNDLSGYSSEPELKPRKVKKSKKRKKGHSGADSLDSQEDISGDPKAESKSKKTKKKRDEISHYDIIMPENREQSKRSRLKGSLRKALTRSSKPK